MRRRLSSPCRFAAVITQVALCMALLVMVLPAQEVLTNQGVIKMVEAGLSEDLVLNVVKQQNSGFTMSSTDLVELKRMNVSERIIAAMMAKTLGPPPSAKPEAAKPKPLPTVSGIYYKKADDWAELLMEEIAWSASGVVNNVRNVVSVGMLKRDVTGTIARTSSRSMLTSPFELLIVPPSGLDIHNFLLLGLKRNKGSREVEIGPSRKGEAYKKAIPFGVEKAGPNQFRLYFPSPLAPGEYGLLQVSQISTENRDNAAPSGRIFTFRVLL